MPRDPDSDVQAQRLELSMREANLDVNKAWLQKAEHLLDASQKFTTDLLHKRVPAEEIPDAIAYGTLFATQAGAIASFVEASGYVEAESAQVDHQRAHVEHIEQAAKHSGDAKEIIEEALQRMVGEMRERGIDASQIPGFPGVVIRPPEDDRPNT